MIQGDQINNFTVPQDFTVPQEGGGNLVLQINQMDPGGECDAILSPTPSQTGSTVVSTTPVIQIETMQDDRVGGHGNGTTAMFTSETVGSAVGAFASPDTVGHSTSVFTTPEVMAQPCMICGDRGSGYHYSVFSCEGCKG